jgi:hypothetical protein
MHDDSTLKILMSAFGKQYRLCIRDKETENVQVGIIIILIFVFLFLYYISIGNHGFWFELMELLTIFDGFP